MPEQTIRDSVTSRVEGTPVRVDDLEVVHSMRVYQAGELVTIQGVQIVDLHGNVLIKPGSPAIVLEHHFVNRSLTIGYMREDTKMMVPIRSLVAEKYVRPRENWDAEFTTNEEGT